MGIQNFLSENFETIYLFYFLFLILRHRSVLTLSLSNGLIFDFNDRALNDLSARECLWIFLILSN